MWSDGHTSHYTSKWLRTRAFREDGMTHRKLMAIGPKKMLWGKEHIDEIRHHNYDEILATPGSMYDWLNGKLLALNREERHMNIKDNS